MKYAGWMIVAVISIIPAFLWYFLGPGPEAFTDYGSVTHAIGELAGLIAMTMFAAITWLALYTNVKVTDTLPK